MMVRWKIHNDKAHMLVLVLQLSVKKKQGRPQVRFGAGRVLGEAYVKFF
jgi:hypothetical protein